MKNVTTLLLILIVFLSACSRIEEPEFREIRNFRVKNLGLDEIRIGLGMAYFNPNEFSVSVKETGARVYLDSVFLGNFVQDKTVEVGEGSEFTISLSGSIPMETFFKMNLEDIHKRQVLVQADGSTKVGKAGIFITKKIAYEGRHRLSQLKF